ncbi:MAG: hypothetical protein NC930_04180 [Candidatus Omnitrophica bacterium]|nr:hypothetical protein [Candidatus Omnitrophota bacterium]
MVHQNFDSLFDRNDDLGFVLKKSETRRVIKSFADGRVVFDALYFTDSKGRRTVGEVCDPGHPHILLFGSALFGLGLNDPDTVQYRLHKELPDSNIFNYSVMGYGPQQMLALLEKGDLSGEVFSSEGVAIYAFEFLDFHRVMGVRQDSWFYGSPHYDFNRKGELQRNGSFRKSRPIITSLHQFYLLGTRVSHFLKLVDSYQPPRISENDIRLTAAIINQSKKLYEEQFHGKFYVLILPSPSVPLWKEERIVDLMEFLGAEGVTCLTCVPEGDFQEYLMNDGTLYNAKFHQFLADQIIHDVLQKEKIGNITS